MSHTPPFDRSGIVGAAIVPHAPQILTLPPTEDKAQVARVALDRAALRERFGINPMPLSQLEQRVAAG